MAGELASADSAGYLDPQPTVASPEVSMARTNRPSSARISGDEEDSRTATAGRKRAFEDEEGTDDQVSRKRAREGGSPRIRAPERQHGPASADNPDDVGSLQQKSSVFSMLREGQEQVGGNPTISKVRPSTTWNNGVQSGLRTSFGGKPKLDKNRSDTRIEIIDLEASENDSPKLPRRSPRSKKPDEYDTTDRFIDDAEQKALPALRGAEPATGNLVDAETSGDASDIEDSASEDRDGEGDEIAVPMRSSVQGDSAQDRPPLGPAPVPPPFFKTLKKADFLKLSPRAQADYQVARAAKKKLVSEYHIASRAYRRKLRLNKKLAKDAANPKRLVPMPKSDAKRDATHAQVAEIIRLAKEWPLSKDYESTANIIQNGLTWYSARGHQDPEPFRSFGKEYQILEILTDGGYPISLRDFSYDTFAPSFLAQNAGSFKALKDSHLKAAFDHYVKWHYAHVPDFLEDYSAFAVAQATLSHGQAKNKAMQSRSSLRWAGPHAQRKILTQAPTRYGIAEDSQPPTDGLSPSSVTENDAIVSSSKLPTDIEEFRPTLATIEDPLVRSTLKFLQQKYYPSSPIDDVLRCLACSKIGHTNAECPSLVCQTCGESSEHSTQMCPKRLPCSKCRVRGHAKKDCPEKLASSEVFCDLCGSTDHWEELCHKVWQSFEPNPNKVYVVSGIPYDCYLCGGNGHYGVQCGLADPRYLRYATFTWDPLNYAIYNDPNSSQRAVAAGFDFNLSPKTIKIKGQGMANDPIELDDSDVEESFIRPPVRSDNGPRPQIQFTAGVSGPPRGPGGQGQSLDMRGPGPNVKGGGHGRGGGKKGKGRPPAAKNGPSGSGSGSKGPPSWRGRGGRGRGR